MRKKSVALLDIRSSEITAVVGERGVNDTFIIKSKYSCGYDGYAEGEFIDGDGFACAVNSAVKSILASTGGIKRFYVGVPGEFLKVVNTDRVMSFQSAKKNIAGGLRIFSEYGGASGGRRLQNYPSQLPLLRIVGQAQDNKSRRYGQRQFAGKILFLSV